jgi:hypothetical protein
VEERPDDKSRRRILAECPDYPTALKLARHDGTLRVYSETQMTGHARLLKLLVTWDRGEAVPESRPREPIIRVPPSEDLLGRETPRSEHYQLP